MNPLKKQIPNLFTLGNLLSGCVGIWMAIEGNIDLAAYAMLAGMGFDFFDGFFARKLGVSGEFGKQLDSLADMVTFGVLPAFLAMWTLENGSSFGIIEPRHDSGFSLLGLILAPAAAFRLARFNVTEQESGYFFGLATPITALFFASLAWILFNSKERFLFLTFNESMTLMVLLASYLMNSNIKLLALKFDGYGLKDNWPKYLLLVLALVLFVFLNFAAFPIIVVTYFVISLIDNSI